MSDKNLTHKDLADALGVSETTIKSYRRKFPDCIPVVSEGKPIRFSESALEVATKIRDYFTTGMSVKEVRTRLANEFSWISLEEQKQKSESNTNKGIPEITQGMSHIATSMVNMAQEQKLLTKRMQTIENQLEELGLRGGDIAVETGKDFSSIEERLNSLESLSQSLTGTMSNLAEKLDCFLESRTKVAEEWRQQKQEITEQVRSNVSSFPSKQKKNVHSQEVPTHTQQGTSVEAQEPSRQFYTLPLVVKTSDSRYMSASGRGRFSLNDLKALLVHSFQPPKHYTMQFEVYGDGWQLFLEQPQETESRSLELLLMELPTQKHGTVIEILQVKDQGLTIHPAEICAILDSFTE